VGLGLAGQFGVICTLLYARVGLWLAVVSLVSFGNSSNHLWVSGWRGPLWCHLEALRCICGSLVGGGQFGFIWKLLEALVGLWLAGASLVSFGGSSRLLRVSGSRGPVWCLFVSQVSN
jgi:hypothetical protein